MGKELERILKNLRIHPRLNKLKETKLILDAQNDIESLFLSKVTDFYKHKHRISVYDRYKKKMRIVKKIRGAK